LAAERKKIFGYTNIDGCAESDPDIVDDVVQLAAFEANSVSVIYACRLFEHLTSDEAMLALKRWWTLLKPGGTLRLSVPDLQAIFEYYNEIQKDSRDG